MTEKQCTLKEKFTLKGIGLHSGKEAILTCKPAKVNFGYQFCRVDINKKVFIPALAENVIRSERNTIIAKEKIKVKTPEHLLSALYGLQIDNCLIEVSGEEIPILDGSAKPFVDEIEKVGVIKQNADRKYFVVNKPYYYKTDGSNAEIAILPDDDFKIDVHLTFNTPFLQNQFASLHNIQRYKTEISECRTFVFFKDLKTLLEKGLIKGGELENALVILDKKVSQVEYKRTAKLFNQNAEFLKEPGLVNNSTFKFANEPARHKLLDVLGDIALCGVFFKGRIIAAKPGHELNTRFAKMIRREIRNLEKKPPIFDVNNEAIMGINQIKKFLPHRSPFLLIDKVVELTNKSIIGLKNVTFNEPFFAGHFPDEPVMPGVLIVEAMAQCGGIFILEKTENPEKYSTYFAKIDNIKFRKKVIPGDTLVFKLTLTSKIRNMVQMEGKAFVGDTLVAEGKFMAQVIKNK